MFTSLADLYFFFPCFNENDLSINKITKWCAITSMLQSQTKPNKLIGRVSGNRRTSYLFMTCKLFCNFISDDIISTGTVALLTWLRCVNISRYCILLHFELLETKSTCRPISLLDPFLEVPSLSISLKILSMPGPLS